jgi:hypothetical protein
MWVISTGVAAEDKNVPLGTICWDVHNEKQSATCGENLERNTVKTEWRSMFLGWGCSSMGEHLPSMNKALGSIPNATTLLSPQQKCSPCPDPSTVFTVTFCVSQLSITIIKYLRQST